MQRKSKDMDERRIHFENFTCQGILQDGHFCQDTCKVHFPQGKRMTFGSYMEDFQ